MKKISFKGVFNKTPNTPKRKGIQISLTVNGKQIIGAKPKTVSKAASSFGKVKGFFTKK